MKNKILLYGDVNLNIIDGSSIWLTSLAKLLSQDKNNVIDILVKEPIISTTIVKSLKEISNVNLIDSKQYVKKIKSVNATNIQNVIEKLDTYRDYSVIILRGFDVVSAMLKSSLHTKIFPYITDFCHNENHISSKEVIKLTTIYNSVDNIFVQTKEMEDYLCRILNVDGIKFTILSPMVFVDNIQKVKIKEKSIIYAGKFAIDWNILELIQIMEKIYKIDKDIKLYVIGDKFNKDIINKKEFILKKFDQLPNIKYIGKLSREATIEYIKSCCIGYNYRSEEVDNNNSLEISTKLIEYSKCGKPTLLRNTQMYRNMLGDDYPLYIDSVDDAVNKIISTFSNDYIYKKAQKLSNKLGNKFEPNQIYAKIKPKIYSYDQKKLRILVSGHDLKFIDSLFPLIREKYELIIQQPSDYMIINKKENKKLLKSVDIIFVEWLLLNAEWYSKHKLPHQKLFIRAHRFEIEKKYGYKLNITNVDKIITVSYNYYEQFIEKFRFPRHKVTIISNYVEIQKLDNLKSLESKYNIALIGCLPSKKGLHRAVNILINLRKIDSRYKLFVAGKKPEDTPFWNLPDQRRYYQKIYQKIHENNLNKYVVFTGWIELSEFLKNIQYTLSLTDYKNSESFHLAPMETIASGGIGLILRWEGCEYTYPSNMIFENEVQIAQHINTLNNNLIELEKTVKLGKDFVKENYDINKIWKIIDSLFENK